MNKFSRITGSIAFWARVITFLGTIPIMVFQKRIMESTYPDTPNVTVFLFDEVFIRFIFLLIVALFLYKKNTNNKTRAIISLYFYLFVTILFSNPIATGISIFLSSRKGPEYLAAKSVILSASQSILYIFTLASNVCFYLSTGSLIASNDDGNQNIKIESDISEKSRTKLVLYSGFLGIFGIDRFYAKRTVSGIVKLLLGLPIIITVILTLINFISISFSDLLFPFLASFRYVFSLNESESLLPSILLVIIIYLPIIIFSVVDFVLCALGKIRDSDNKLIIKW